MSAALTGRAPAKDVQWEICAAGLAWKEEAMYWLGSMPSIECGQPSWPPSSIRPCLLRGRPFERRDSGWRRRGFQRWRGPDGKALRGTLPGRPRVEARSVLLAIASAKVRVPVTSAPSHNHAPPAFELSLTTFPSAEAQDLLLRAWPSINLLRWPALPIEPHVYPAGHAQSLRERTLQLAWMAPYLAAHLYGRVPAFSDQASKPPCLSPNAILVPSSLRTGCFCGIEIDATGEYKQKLTKALPSQASRHVHHACAKV
jgi:hypothetical protein